MPVNILARKYKTSLFDHIETLPKHVFEHLPHLECLKNTHTPRLQIQPCIDNTFIILHLVLSVLYFYTVQYSCSIVCECQSLVTIKYCKINLVTFIYNYKIVKTFLKFILCSF